MLVFGIVDFQMAHKSIWFNEKDLKKNVKCFSMYRYNFKKICNYGYKLKILNKPDVFYMSHPARSSHNNKNLMI